MSRSAKLSYKFLHDQTFIGARNSYSLHFNAREHRAPMLHMHTMQACFKKGNYVHMYKVTYAHCSALGRRYVRLLRTKPHKSKPLWGKNVGKSSWIYRSTTNGAQVAPDLPNHGQLGTHATWCWRWANFRKTIVWLSALCFVSILSRNPCYNSILDIWQVVHKSQSQTCPIYHLCHDHLWEVTFSML